MIYFIMSGDLVKIGYSNDPKRRLAMLSTGCPTECRLIGVMPGDKAKESELHKRFASERVRGEWFNFTVEMNILLGEHAVHVPPKEPTINHPLASFISRSGTTITEFARRAGTSRNQLYRIMQGQNTTTDRLRAICAATGGAVSMEAFFGEVSV